MNRAPTTEAERAPGIMSGVSSEDVAEERSNARGRRPSVPLVPALGVLLVLLLGAVAFLWFTRPEAAAIRADDYAEALQAARSNVVDLTSFDHLTYDDDIEEARRVTTGELRQATVDRLEKSRKQIVDGKVVNNSEVLDAGVTRVTDDAATVVLLIESTEGTEESERTGVRRYPVEVQMVKQDGRWLLSRITGR